MWRSIQRRCEAIYRSASLSRVSDRCIEPPHTTRHHAMLRHVLPLAGVIIPLITLPMQKKEERERKHTVRMWRMRVAASTSSSRDLSAKSEDANANAATRMAGQHGHDSLVRVATITFGCISLVVSSHKRARALDDNSAHARAAFAFSLAATTWSDVRPRDLSNSIIRRCLRAELDASQSSIWWSFAKHRRERTVISTRIVRLTNRLVSRDRTIHLSERKRRQPWRSHSKGRSERATCRADDLLQRRVSLRVFPVTGSYLYVRVILGKFWIDIGVISKHLSREGATPQIIAVVSLRIVDYGRLLFRDLFFLTVLCWKFVSFRFDATLYACFSKQDSKKFLFLFII